MQMPHCFGRSKQAPHYHSHHWSADAESDRGDCSLSSLKTPIPKRSQDAQFQEKGQCQVRVFENCEDHLSRSFLLSFLCHSSCEACTGASLLVTTCFCSPVTVGPSRPATNTLMSQWKLASRSTGIPKPPAASSELKPCTMLRRPRMACIASSWLSLYGASTARITSTSCSAMAC